MNIKLKSLIISACFTIGFVVIGVLASSYLDEDTFNMFALDKTLLIVGMFMGISKAYYDYESNRLRKVERKRDIKNSIRDKQEYLLKNTVKEGEVNSLILIVPANSNNLTAEYLIKYFKPRKVSLIWSSASKSIEFAKSLHQLCCDLNIESVRDPNKTTAYNAANFFVIDDIVDSIKASIKLLNSTPGSIGIDLTSGTALCSIGSSIAAMQTGINPMYVIVDKSKGDEEFIVRDDIDRLEDISLRASAIQAGGICVYKAPWSQEDRIWLDLLVPGER